MDTLDTKYLGQYIRNQEKMTEMFQRSENYLMIYESVEVVDQDERVKKLEEKQEQSRIDMIALTNIMAQLADIKADNARKDTEIKKLQNIFESKEYPQYTQYPKLEKNEIISKNINQKGVKLEQRT